MSYLLLAVLSIIVYAEVLPTLSIMFEYVRTLFASKITIIQQNTVHAQEDIQETQARIEPQHSTVIGFQAPDIYEVDEYDE